MPLPHDGRAPAGKVRIAHAPGLLAKMGESIVQYNTIMAVLAMTLAGKVRVAYAPGLLVTMGESTVQHNTIISMLAMALAERV